jgi:hypothetical protein
MAIDEKVIDQLLASQGNGPLELAGENGLLKQTDESAGGTGHEGGTDPPPGI